MRLSRWFLPKVSSSRSTRSTAGFRPMLETLEDRCLLSPSGLGDEVLRWNTVATNAQIVDLTPGYTVPGAGANAQPGPAMGARALAIVQTGIYDAVNSITQMYTPYLVTTPAPSDASIDAAIAQAGHDTLVSLYPLQKASFDQDLAQDLAAIPGGQSKIDGIQAGATAAAAIIAARANDNAEIMNSYTPGTAPGDWQPDPLHPTQQAYAPDYGFTTPFAINSPLEFQAPPPPALGSPQYEADLQEVETLGGNGTTTPTTRTQAQTYMGLFWAYDGSPGVGLPPDLYNQITQTIAVQENNTEIQNARLFFLVNIALADAAVTAWNTKYDYNFWRPITAIRASGLGGGNDPTWTYLGAPADNPQLSGKSTPPTNFTPAFPSYTSGHATFGAALFQTLTDFYGTDNITFTFTSTELNGTTIGVDANGNPYTRPLVPMTFTSFSEAAYDNAESRIYLGIHWGFDRDEGLQQGEGVGNAVFGKEAAFAQDTDGTYNNSIYLAMLNRRVDAAGSTYMDNMRGQGLIDTQMVQQISDSTEYRSIEVQQAFQQFLHRAADQAGITFYTNMLANGGTIEEMDASIMSSQEYNAGLSSNSDFLTAVYQDVLGRSVEMTGQQFWTQMFAQGETRDQVALQIMQSTEARSDMIQGYYQQFLGRAADASGMNTYLGALQNGQTQQAVIASILGSTEYSQRVTQR